MFFNPVGNVIRNTTEDQVGMKGRFVCHEHKSDTKSDVSQLQTLVISCKYIHFSVLKLSPEGPH